MTIFATDWTQLSISTVHLDLNYDKLYNCKPNLKNILYDYEYEVMYENIIVLFFYYEWAKWMKFLLVVIYR